MDINVKLLDESTVTIKVEASSTIKALKVALQKEKGIATDEQLLIFAGKEIEDDRTISSYGIQQGSKVIMSSPSRIATQYITVKDNNGHIYQLVMSPSDSVTKAKQLIEEKEGIALLDQRLSFCGKELEDDYKLLDYNIRSGNRLDLFIRKRHTQVPLTVSLSVDSSSGSSSDSDSDHSDVPEGNPIPLEAAIFISGLCEKHLVKFPLMIQDPADCKSIVVTGVGVSKIESELCKLQASCPDLKICVQEQDGPLLTKQQTIKVEKKSPVRHGASSWTTVECATIELFVSAKEMNRDYPEPTGVVYAVVPAHLTMSDTQRQEYANVNSIISIARNEVEQETTRTRYTANATVKCLGVDLKHPPLFGYSHWFPEDSDNKFMNDVALLQLNKQDATHLQLELDQSHLNGVKKIKEFSSADALESMCRSGQAIVIGKREGNLVSLPQDAVRQAAGQDRSSYRLHLPFILTSKDTEGNLHKLEPGHCGTILFYKSRYGKLLAMGLFVGELNVTFPSGTVIYQAIALSEALKEIENDYPHQVANIKPFKT